MRAKQNGGLLLRKKQAPQLSTCLSKPLTAQRYSRRWTIEPWNHRTIERKISNRTRMWSAAGWFIRFISIRSQMCKTSMKQLYIRKFPFRNGILSAITVQNVPENSLKTLLLWFLFTTIQALHRGENNRVEDLEVKFLNKKASFLLFSLTENWSMILLDFPVSICVLKQCI